MRFRPPIFEVQHSGEIVGLFSFEEITRKLRLGELELSDSYRRAGKTEWKRIDHTLERKRRSEFILFGLSAIGFILTGLWVTWWGMKVLTWDRESTTWPSAMGRITYSYVENNSDHSNRFNYHPVVGYEYEVDGHTRSSNSVYPECLTGREAWAQSVVERYPVESRHLVHYESSRSRLAMLEPGLHPHSFFCIGIGWMLLYTGTLMAITTLLVRRRPLIPRPSRAKGTMFLIAYASVFIGFTIVSWLP